MDEELKLLALQVVDKIAKKLKKESKENFYQMGKKVDIGADGTATKYIDKIAEDVALKIIEKSKIKVNVLSEEAGFLDFGGEYTFVLDPVDGTRNAYRGIPFYSVSLAIGKSKLSDVEYGIVKNVPTGDTFIAEKKLGSFLNNKQIRVCDYQSRNMVSSLTLGRNIDPKTRALSKKHNVRSLGSCSLEMCMVAVGALDFYLAGKEYMRVTDLAASTLIVREAGGFVKNIYGEELEMELTLDERTSVAAACTEELIQSIIS
jgi:fructose-1,6-bisphosphatase/inositol monophosphatase family enzyme